MKTFKFDLVLSGLSHTNDQELKLVGQELQNAGCVNPLLRREPDGVRMTVEAQAQTITQAIYSVTRQVASTKKFRLSVRSVEFG